MPRLAIAALLSVALAAAAVAQPRGFSRANAELDADTAAYWQHRIDVLENKPLTVSRETQVKEKKEDAATVARLRQRYAGTDQQQAFEREYDRKLRELRGQGPSLRDIGSSISYFAGKLSTIAGLSLVTIIGSLVTIIGSLGTLAVVGFVVYYFVTLLNMPTPEKTPPPLTTIHGSASFAPQIRQTSFADSMLGVFLGKSSTPNLQGVPLEQDPGAPLYSLPEHHVLIVAMTRTGKGTRILIPTLGKYFGSMLVIDPKGELSAITARERARWQEKENVHILNPWGVKVETFEKLGFPPATYNPLDILDRNDPNAVSVAQSLAAAVCPHDASGKDAYWSDAAASLLTAVFLWLADRPGETKTLARAREIVSLPRKKLTADFLVDMSTTSAFDGAIRENAATFIDLAPDTYSGVMSNLSQHTKFLSDKQVKAATATSSFSMEKLAMTPATVYLVIPPDLMPTQHTWLRLIVTAAMYTFKRFPHEKRPAGHRCMFLIDEFPALGRLEDFPGDIATMSGYGVDFTLAVQGLHQLRDIYGDAADTIISNCAFQWFCNLNDLKSAEYLSKTLGKATVQTTSTTHGEKSSVSYSETGRDLVTPDEAMRLGKDVAILIHPGSKPHYLRPVDYWNLQDAFAMYAEAEPRLFWNPPPEFDPNPYR